MLNGRIYNHLFNSVIKFLFIVFHLQNVMLNMDVLHFHSALSFWKVFPSKLIDFYYIAIFDHLCYKCFFVILKRKTSKIYSQLNIPSSPNFKIHKQCPSATLKVYKIYFDQKYKITSILIKPKHMGQLSIFKLEF